jgi:dihydrofolate synthase/folylpolyglutamate synthase
MKFLEILDYLKNQDMTMTRYERDEWDAFVAKTKLRIAFPFIHITGSNGKGSTAHYLYEIYRAEGYKVALFSKPYFRQVNEMMEVNGKLITDEDFARIFTLREKEIKAGNLSSFEIETYIALAYFNEQKPDLAIIECGMGGATDSTNLAEAIPVLSIITTVSLEHTSFLGRTVSEIARNKAGIIKAKAPILVGKLEDSASDVIKDIARKRESPFFPVDDFHNERYEAPYYHFDYRPYGDLRISTPAKYQLSNAAVALEGVKILQGRFPVKEASLRAGLLASPLPCRLERHQNIILDGAHNPEAVEALMESLVPLAGDKPIHVVFASYRDKNIAVELPRIGRESKDITLTTFASPRARQEEDYLLYEGDYPFDPDYKNAIASLAAQFPEDIILVTGSLAFASVARTYVTEGLKR